MGIRENDYIVILSPMVTKLGLSGNKLIIFALIYGFCRDGESEFLGSINYICEWTGVSRNTVLSTLKELVDDGLIEKRDYKVNNVKFCAYKTGSAVFAPQVEKMDEGGEIIEPNNTKDNTKEKKERENSEKDKELFEECWLAYRRKGSKKDSLAYWNKLTDVERQNVLPHIKAYVATRDLQFQKDFQRYLRDKIFQTVVVSGKNVAYDPTRLGNGESANDVYMPSGNFSLTWDDTIKAYLYIGYYMDGIGVPDGYTDDNRPDGATIVLNNGRGTIVWSSKERRWNRTRL